MSEGEQVVFGRPDGVDGAFAPESVRSATSARGPQPRAAAPDPVLTEAFSRPPGATEALQRDPYAGPLVPDPEPEPEDPWRDTDSLAGIGEPGVPAPPQAVAQPDPERLGVRDVLFGRRVSFRALAVLGVLALVIGLLGGAIGRITGTTVQQLTDSRVSLQVDDAKVPDEGAYAELAAKVAASVVTIEVTTKTSGSLGSGSVVDAKGGYIMTNNHVIDTAKQNKDAKVEVIFSSGQRVPAKLVGSDPGTDLAVVQVAVDGLQQITLGDSDQLVPGQQVVAIGSPEGLRQTVTTGVVSAIHRPVQGPSEAATAPSAFDSVQTDAAINHGNSGGPLIDLKGRQIGVNTLGIAPGGGSIGLNFAIASNVARPIVEAIIRGEKITHADLGINGREVSNDSASGVGVENVKRGSAAEKAGIREGDVVTKVGDKEIVDYASLVVYIRAVGVGKETTVTVVRDGRQVPIKVTPEPLS
ncbi:S1C family serine protease [Tsukamurella ocularis]|uniref:S1C family serine protease n=1 Tax=Tsukamurella ocularis TaxID=1970234 RepID=UPI0021693A43|nr:trypsin-like peptidase domain-containing protein [Tsukamurella ocularis]MCS3781661.1 S1-C subfamily serine protease [Tsukamurella ocularis]MCS3788155.1 S1-C subfamily serine protease [Tsukamurella ocularis]MCS3851875.1 S1-C subfamily serine protease [Tsukamurella ocularis]